MPKKKKVRVKKNKRKPFSEKISDQSMVRFRTLISASLHPFEQQLNLLAARFEEAKGNLIVLNTLLKDKGIIKEDEYLKEFEEYEKSTRGMIKDGKMVGSPVFSLYNLEDSL